MFNPYQAAPLGLFGSFGGCYIPEILYPAITELTKQADYYLNNPEFQQELSDLFCHYAGRPTALTPATRLSETLGAPKIYLKREDLLHTGAHKINNALGQCLLAKAMGKTRIIAETGAGQHGVATATACAKLNLPCVVYMGEVDVKRQAVNVAKMTLLGATVVPVTSGQATLKEAVNAALRDWSGTFENTHYCLGSALGPHPFPSMVAFFQQVIGNEARKQLFAAENRLPSHVIACVGGGSNAIGIFQAFLNDPQIKLIGIEAGGRSSALEDHAARFAGGRPGVLHGSYTYVLQTDDGQIAGTHSISAGLDYPAIGPQHADLFEHKRALYDTVSDDEARAAFKLLTRTEGIIPALESAHAIAYVIKQAKNYLPDDLILINLSGRGDKDLEHHFSPFKKGGGA